MLHRIVSRSKQRKYHYDEDNYFCSTMEEPTLEELLEALSSLQAMTMMRRSMNMVTNLSSLCDLINQYVFDISPTHGSYVLIQ